MEEPYNVQFNPSLMTPIQKNWQTVNAESYRDASIVALKLVMPRIKDWNYAWALVYKHDDPVYSDGMPITVQSFRIEWGGEDENNEVH